MSVWASAPRLVGRGHELALIDESLDELAVRPTRYLVLAGEPGIGKTRLLQELRERAELRDYLTLDGRAVEFESDLPYAICMDALDAYLRSLPARRLGRLGIERLDALAPVAPGLAIPGSESAVTGDRHGVHEAVRQLLEGLASARPVVIALDDVQWADGSSIDLLAALLVRPPAGRALLALAHRRGQLAPQLTSALSRSASQGGAVEIVLGGLSEEETVELVGAALRRAEIAALHQASGGNPFYIEQLARSVSAPRRGGAGLDLGVAVPPAVMASLEGELAALSEQALLVLRAAAVVGDPFEPDLAAEVAELDEQRALGCLDELIAVGLVRGTDVPRRFTIRHPLVRRALYLNAPGGWRIGAHARAAESLQRRGASLAERAHHVEQAASRGDEGAIALLTAAAESLQQQAPASAAGYYHAALELLPAEERATPRRAGVLAALGWTLASAGRLEESRNVLVEALPTLPAEARELRERLTFVCAAIEQATGRRLESARRLRGALAGGAAEPSGDRSVMEVMLACQTIDNGDIAAAREPAERALLEARAAGDRMREASALAVIGLIAAAAGRPAAAAEPLRAAAAIFEAADDFTLAPHLYGLQRLALAELLLDRFEAALARSRSAAELGQRNGHNYLLAGLLADQIPPLIQLGRIAEAVALGERALAAAWTSGNPEYRRWAQGELARARLWHGQLEAAEGDARESVALAHAHASRTIWEARAGCLLGEVRMRAGDTAGGLRASLRAAGGPEATRLLPAERPRLWADLAEGWLHCGELASAREAAERIEAAATAGAPLVHVLARRTRAAVLLADERPAEAAVAAGAASAAADSLGAKLDAALAQFLRGRALDAAGQREAAVAEVSESADRLGAAGALHHQSEAERELRRLGVRIWRRGPRPGDSAGVASLTERERELAELVTEGKTNRQIATELFLSVKTIEAHLRNVYAKVGIRSRTELAREIERNRLG